MTTQTKRADEEIIEEVTAWPGVHAVDGKRGELSLRLGRRELGHLHGDRVLHIGFPKRTWHALYAGGKIDYHPVFPGRPGFAARRIEGPDDVREVVALLRMNYDRAVEKHGIPSDDGDG